MDSVGIPWNSDIPVGIRWIPLELMGESKDLLFSGDFVNFLIIRIDSRKFFILSFLLSLLGIFLFFLFILTTMRTGPYS